MGSCPGQARHNAVLDRENLIDSILPVGKAGPGALCIASERVASAEPRSARATEADVRRQQLIYEVELPLVPKLVVEPSNDGFVRLHHRGLDRVWTCRDARRKWTER